MTIDDLLSQPLTPMADNGFSAKVMARIYRLEQRRLLANSLLVVLIATVACLLMPMTDFLLQLNAALDKLVVAIGSSPQIAFAALILGAIFFYERKIFHS